MWWKMILNFSVKITSSHEDIKKFLDNVEKSESTEGSSIFINNTQTFLLPLNSSSQQMFNMEEKEVVFLTLI